MVILNNFTYIYICTIFTFFLYIQIIIKLRMAINTQQQYYGAIRMNDYTKLFFTRKIKKCCRRKQKEEKLIKI